MGARAAFAFIAEFIQLVDNMQHCILMLFLAVQVTLIILVISAIASKKAACKDSVNKLSAHLRLRNIQSYNFGASLLYYVI